MELREKLTLRLVANEDLEAINDMHPFDLVALYEELDKSSQAYLLTLLSEETYADVLSYLEPERAADFLELLDLTQQQTIVNLIDPDDAADIIAELTEKVGAELVSSLGEENKAVALLKYSDDQAGSVMNNLFMVVGRDDEVKTATRKVIKQAGDVSSLQTIFVTDDKGIYFGQVPLKTLLKAKPPLLVSDILMMETSFKDSDSLEDVITFMKDYSEHDLAITNNDGVLVGVITASDIIEEVHADALEDFAKLSALPSNNTYKNIFASAFTRLPWLLGLLVLSLFIALITSQFEAVIQATVALAFFQPLILDVGGDVASQTLAVTLISLNNEDSDLKKTAKKEVVSGLIIAVGLSVVSFVITYLFALLNGYIAPIMLALVVSLSLIITVFIAFVFGFITPVILHRLKFDPAVASGPFITTSIDILSLLVYFSLAMLIL